MVVFKFINCYVSLYYIAFLKAECATSFANLFFITVYISFV